MQSTHARTPETQTPGTNGEGAQSGAVRHAFAGDFLRRLKAADAPPSAAAAALAGPWEVVEEVDGAAVVDAVTGEVAARCESRQDALLLAAALPGNAAAELRLAERPGCLYGDGRGYELRAGGRPVGSLSWFDTRLVATLEALRALVASPRGLALLLEAAGHDALDRAGRLLAARVEGAGDDTAAR
ncbi:MAG TPA: hypothetical protein VKU40_01145 [Thermoanaerobaculia bacterium]|nr:hypothetical protein [Thermoanaerobaculia bacterium]